MEGLRADGLTSTTFHFAAKRLQCQLKTMGGSSGQTHLGMQHEH
jgi:hypothetical protein